MPSSLRCSAAVAAADQQAAMVMSFTRGRAKSRRSASSAAVIRSGLPAAVAGDVDDVPALGLFEDDAEAIAGDAVLQDAHVGGLTGIGDLLDELDERVALAAQIEGLAAVREAEQA
jgi:hypothetical protein